MEEKRRSLYDVFKDNLAMAERKTFLHRLIYIGQHRFQDNPFQAGPQIKHFFEGSVRTINEGYCDEALTGFFMYYTEYFIHFIEGSEETINKHLLSLVKEIDEQKAPITSMKVLLMCFHINQRFYDQWAARPARPPTLIERISPDSDNDEAARQLQICVAKLYQLAEYLQQQSISTLRSTMDHLSERVPQYLPECGLLDFLLGVPWLLQPQQMVSRYAQLPVSQYYMDYIWPAPTDYVPYNVFLPDPKNQQ